MSNIVIIPQQIFSASGNTEYRTETHHSYTLTGDSGTIADYDIQIGRNNKRLSYDGR